MTELKILVEKLEKLTNKKIRLMESKQNYLNILQQIPKGKLKNIKALITHARNSAQDWPSFIMQLLDSLKVSSNSYDPDDITMYPAEDMMLIKFLKQIDPSITRSMLSFDT